MVTDRLPASSRAKVLALPNFRDHGRTVDRALLRLVPRLAQKWGEAFVSERSLRQMIYEDTGHMPGVTTLAKAIVRLGAQGLIVQVWLHAGQILPDGSVCTHGVRKLWCPQNRRQRRTAQRDFATKDRRIGEKNRFVPARKAPTLLRTLAAGLAAPPVAERTDPRAAKDAALAALAALAAQWEREGKPPD